MLKRSVLIPILVAVLAVPSLGLAGAPSPTDPLDLVDPMVGTDIYNGALYPGATLPFGIVKLSPDTLKPSTAGYNPAQPIIGFSHTHIGGTGGAAIYGQ
jgi:putative alpha-1,2-mannosidase